MTNDPDQTQEAKRKGKYISRKFQPIPDRPAIDQAETRVMPTVPTTPPTKSVETIDQAETRVMPTVPATPPIKHTGAIDQAETRVMPAIPPIMLPSKSTGAIDQAETRAMPSPLPKRPTRKRTTVDLLQASLTSNRPLDDYDIDIDDSETQIIPSIFSHLTSGQTAADRKERITGFMSAVQSTPFSLDNFAIDQQATWMLPAIVLPSKGKVAQRPGKVTPATTAPAQKEEATGYSSTLRKLLQSSGIYALASFVSPLIALVLAPFLTRNLTTTEYGVFAVCTTAIALLVGITQLGLNNAFFRAYSLDYEDPKDRVRVVSTLVSLLLLISIPITVLLIIAAPWISLGLLGSLSFSDAIKLVAIVMFLQNMTVPGFSWLRAEGRATFFSLLSICNLLLSLSCNLVLVGVFHLGLLGSLASTASGYGLVVLCTLPIILFRVGLRMRKDIMQNLLSFGVPLVANFVAVWVLQLADRYLLSRLGSLSETGSYAVAYTLGNVMGAVVLGPFSLAWPATMFSIAKREDAPQVFKLIFRWYSLALLLVTFVFSLASTCILYLFFPPSYHSAAGIIPIIALSIMCYGIYDMFSTGVGVKRKNWYAVMLTAIVAFINIVFNILLIPLFGSMGAAFATLIAYAVLAIAGYFVNQHFYPIPFEVGKLLLGLFVGLSLFIGATIMALPQGLFMQIVIYGSALCLFALFLGLLGNPFPLIQKLKNKRRRIA